MSTTIDTETHILEALDWEPTLPCESTIHAQDHDAEWSLTLTCGHGALLCTPIKDRCLDMLGTAKGYCPECLATDAELKHLAPIGKVAQK